MASKLVCDWCGKDIVKGKTSWMKYKVEYAQIVWKSPFVEPDEIMNDLCEECAKSFLEWMNKETQ